MTKEASGWRRKVRAYIVVLLFPLTLSAQPDTTKPAMTEPLVSIQQLDAAMASLEDKLTVKDYKTVLYAIQRAISEAAVERKKRPKK